MSNLYHYTSVQGFESIIKNQCLRMTRSDFMNDPRDCQVFFDIVERYIEKISVDEISYSLNLNHRELVLKTVKQYPAADYLRFIVDNIPIYVLSLTTEPDSLPMWNYYSGDGVQFAFDKALLLGEISKRLCRKNFDFVAATEIEYIDAENSAPIDLKLNSFSDFNVYYYSESKNTAVQYMQDLKHRAEGDLEFFVDSFVKSYLNTASYCLDFTESRTEFFSKIFYTNRDIVQNRPQFNLKFKADIDLYMLILATHFKPKTFSNEKEHRIVFFHYDLSGRARKLECYALSSYRFGTCLRPYIECRFNEENRSFLDMIRSVTLSPTTVKMPFDSNAYRGVICNFLNQYGGDFSVEQIHLSGHDIRW